MPDPPGAQSQRIKLHVKEPEQTPKLKLSASIKRPTEEPGNYSVDTEALKRQRQLVLDGVHGRVGQPSGTPTPALARESSSISVRGERDASINGATTIKLQSDESKGLQQLRDGAQSTNGNIGASGISQNDLPTTAANMMPPPTTPLGSIVRPLSQPRPPPIQQPRLPWDTWRRSDRPEALRMFSSATSFGCC